MTPFQAETKHPLKKFALDYIEAERKMKAHLKRDMSLKESNYLFTNFLRRKMGLGFLSDAKKQYGIFGSTIKIDRINNRGLSAAYKRMQDSK